MAEIHQQERRIIVLALTDHDLGNEGQIEIDVTGSSEALTRDAEDSHLLNPFDISTDGSGRDTGGSRHCTDIIVVQIPKERRVSISRRLKQQNSRAKALEDKLQQKKRDRQRMIDSLFDEHKDLSSSLHELEAMARDKEKNLTEVLTNSPLDEGCRRPRQKAIPVHHYHNLEGRRTQPSRSQIPERQQNMHSYAYLKKRAGRHHANSMDENGLRPTTKKRILPMTIMRLL